VNQCIGRGIRHKKDYSAIILMDERFKIEENVQKLSKWMRKNFKSMSEKDLLERLQNFFANKKT
jgi:Fanconi anemia group J protein